MAGLLNARLPELKLNEVGDPREGRLRWALPQLLTAVLAGLMAGCRNLPEVEQVTELMSKTVRRLLKLPRRLADTTMRDVICRLNLDDLRAVLHRAVKAAARRGALEPVGLPFGVAALDGKSTALPCWDDQYVQRHVPAPEQGLLPFGLARTVTCCLVSARGRPCIDAVPLPMATNEMGHFKACFESVVKTYGELFQLVTYDAGALSDENGRLVVAAGKDYCFRLRGEQRTMFKLVSELLDPTDVAGETVDVLDNHTTVTRKLVVLQAQQHWAYGNGKSPAESIWAHARTFLRVESTTAKDDGTVVHHEVRLFASSLCHDKLSAAQWLLVVRSHWGVENNNHHTFDVAFEEDDRPWIRMSTNGMLAVLLLRRIAYTLMTLYRSVTQRSDENRGIAWKKLMRQVFAMLVGATDEQLAGLRERGTTAVCG